jgi:Tfp pilus assembly protein PilV
MNAIPFIRSGPSRLRSRGRRRGFSLVEVVLSLGIVTFCSVTLVALIPVGLSANKASREQITALNLCRSIESDLKATPAGAGAKSPLYAIAMPAAGATSTPVMLYDTYAGSTTSFGTTIQPSSQYRFTITLTGPPTTSPNDPVNVTIQATWPASVVPASPVPPQINPPNVVGTVNLDVAINRFGS